MLGHDARVLPLELVPVSKFVLGHQQKVLFRVVPMEGTCPGTSLNTAFIKVTLNFDIYGTGEEYNLLALLGRAPSNL